MTKWVLGILCALCLTGCGGMPDTLDTDVAQSVIASFYQDVGGPASYRALTEGKTNSIAHALSQFNLYILNLLLFVILYSGFIVSYNMARSGEFLSRGQGKLLPLRIVAAVALVLPTSTGYCLAQIVIITILSWGSSFANAVYLALFEFLDTTGFYQVKAPDDSELFVQAEATLQGLISGALCIGAKNQQSAQRTAKTGVTQPDFSFRRQDELLVFDASCGSVKLGLAGQPNAATKAQAIGNQFRSASVLINYINANYKQVNNLVTTNKTVGKQDFNRAITAFLQSSKGPLKQNASSGDLKPYEQGWMFAGPNYRAIYEYKADKTLQRFRLVSQSGVSKPPLTSQSDVSRYLGANQPKTSSTLQSIDNTVPLDELRDNGVGCMNKIAVSVPVAFGVFAGTTIAGGAASGTLPVAETLAKAFNAGILILVTAAIFSYGMAFMKAVLIPLIPVLVYLTAVSGWLIMGMLAMVAAPVIAVGIAWPDGQSPVWGRAYPAVMILLNLLLRPVLSLLGLLIAMFLLQQILTSLQAVMSTGASFFLDSQQGVAADIDKFLPYASVCGELLFFDTNLTSLPITVAETFAFYAIVRLLFSFVYLLPDRVLTHIGGQATGLTNTSEFLDKGYQGAQQGVGTLQSMGQGVVGEAEKHEKSMSEAFKRFHKKQKENENKQQVNLESAESDDLADGDIELQSGDDSPDSRRTTGRKGRSNELTSENLLVHDNSYEATTTIEDTRSEARTVTTVVRTNRSRPSGQASGAPSASLIESDSDSIVSFGPDDDLNQGAPSLQHTQSMAEGAGPSVYSQSVLEGGTVRATGAGASDAQSFKLSLEPGGSTPSDQALLPPPQRVKDENDSD